jgi:hypothetical protein
LHQNILKKLLVERRYLIIFLSSPIMCRLASTYPSKMILFTLRTKLVDLGLEIIVPAKLIHGTLDAGILENFHLSRLNIFQIIKKWTGNLLTTTRRNVI